MSQKRRLLRPHIGGAIYILPNLLTTGNLFFGFFSIVKSMQGDFVWAASAIFLAAIFDVLDGRVARLTNGTSEFGVQYDSLCDLVSFGLAPAFMSYQYALGPLGRVGWIFCFIFLACGALRLARFNVQSSIGKASGDFTGLPIPMAAGVLASLIACLEELKEDARMSGVFFETLNFWVESFDLKTILLLVLTPLLAFLMVSNIAFRSHKSLKVKSIKPFKLLALCVVVVGLIAFKPAFLGFVFFGGYALFGLFEYILGWRKAEEDEDIFAEDSTGLLEPSGEEEEGDG